MFLGRTDWSCTSRWAHFNVLRHDERLIPREIEAVWAILEVVSLDDEVDRHGVAPPTVGFMSPEWMGWQRPGDLVRRVSPWGAILGADPAGWGPDGIGHPIGIGAVVRTRILERLEALRSAGRRVVTHGLWR